MWTRVQMNKILVLSYIDLDPSFSNPGSNLVHPAYFTSTLGQLFEKIGFGVPQEEVGVGLRILGVIF